MRIGTGDIKAIEKLVNAQLAENGAHSRVKVGQRYNYCAIDEIFHSDDPNYEWNGGILRTIRSGMTKQETYEFLYAMSQALSLI